MSGYNGYSMSNNAVMAYENGEKPFSKWTKAEILEVLAEKKTAEYMEAVKRLTVSETKSLFLNMTSWHHTSSMFNRTEFYSVSLDIPIEAIAGTIARRTPKHEKKADTAIKARIIYGEWTGSRRHPKLVETESYAVIVGNWAYLPGGQKKRTDGKHVKVLETYKTAPKGTADTFKEITRRMAK